MSASTRNLPSRTLVLTRSTEKSSPMTSAEMSVADEVDYIGYNMRASKVGLDTRRRLFQKTFLTPRKPQDPVMNRLQEIITTNEAAINRL